MATPMRYRSIAGGQRGNYVATVTWEDGTAEELGCINSHFLRGSVYCDPYINSEELPNSSKQRKLVQLLRDKGKAILRIGKLVQDTHEFRPSYVRQAERGYFQTSYGDVFDVSDVRVDANGLHLIISNPQRQKIPGR
jgi:hypothetical protein